MNIETSFSTNFKVWNISAELGDKLHFQCNTLHWCKHNILTHSQQINMEQIFNTFASGGKINESFCRKNP